MAKTVVYSCDVCGRTKGETNNWFTSEVVGPAEPDGRCPGIEIEHFNYSNVSTLSYAKHLCSEECLTRMVSRWVHTGSLEKTQTEKIMEFNEAVNK